MASDPRASRPHMPEYGLASEDAGEGLLPWSWAVIVEGRVERADAFPKTATRWRFATMATRT